MASIQQISSKMKELFYWNDEYTDLIIEYYSQRCPFTPDLETLFNELIITTDFSGIISKLSEIEFYQLLIDNEINVNRIKEIEKKQPDFLISTEKNKFYFEVYSPISYPDLKNNLAHIKNRIGTLDIPIGIQVAISQDFNKKDNAILIDIIQNAIKKFKPPEQEIKFKIINDEFIEIKDSREENCCLLSLFETNQFYLHCRINEDKSCLLLDGVNPPIRQGNEANIIDLRNKIKDKWQHGQLVDYDYGFLVINFDEYMHLSPNLEIPRIFFGSLQVGIKNDFGHYDNSGIFDSENLLGGVIFISRNYRNNSSLGTISIFKKEIIEKERDLFEKIMKGLRLGSLKYDGIHLQRERIY